MILLLLGWSPVGGVVGFILLVRKKEGLVGFPFGGEARWAGLKEGRSEWVRALVVCVCVGGGGYVFWRYNRGFIFPVLILFFYYLFLILILHNYVWKIDAYSLLKIWTFKRNFEVLFI